MVSVVTPVFNEEKTVVEAVQRILLQPGVDELVVVDDGSTDRTSGLLARMSRQKKRLKVFRQSRRRGKGAALQRGFREARGQVLFIQDADLEYDIQALPRMIEPIAKGKADAVFGSRFISAEPHRVLYYHHRMANGAITALSNLFTNLNLTDVECGQKAFRREVLKGVNLVENRFGVEVELAALVGGGGWRVFEVGVPYSGRTYAEGKKIRWPDALDAIRAVVAGWLRHRIFSSRDPRW